MRLGLLESVTQLNSHALGAQAPVFLCRGYAKAWLRLVSMTKNMTINCAEK